MKRFEDLVENDVILFEYRDEPDDEPSLIFARVNRKDDFETWFKDVYCKDINLSTTEYQADSNYIFKNFLFNQPNIVDKIKQEYPEYFL